MRITVKARREDVQIITDLDVLHQVQTLSDKLAEYEREAPGLTEGEEAQRVKARKACEAELAECYAKVDDSTLIVPLTGLNSSTWDAIVSTHTTTNSKGEPVQDLPSITRDAFEKMAGLPHWKTKPGDTIDMSAEEMHDFVESLTSSQLMSLLVTVQQLNMPATSLPKHSIPSHV